MSPGPGWLVLVGWAACDSPDERPRPGPASELPVHPAPMEDRDGDGWADEVDCAPEDPERHPDAREVCNGLDDDCNGLLPADDVDNDGDGHMVCVDCWDAEPTFHPGADDPLGDDLDQNCDGTDGVGTGVTGAVLEGQVRQEVAGWSLAAADADGDGCAELAVGQPGYILMEQVSDFDGHVSVSEECEPDRFRTLTGPPDPGRDRNPFFGKRVSIAGPWLGVEDNHHFFKGRVSVYDAASVSEGALPVLEVRGWDYWPVNDGTLLGPDWVMVSRAAWPVQIGWPAGYRLVSTARTGVVDFADEAAPAWDHELFTDDEGGRAGHVGDRDGDGSVDLGVWVESFDGVSSSRFFPAPTTAHVDDAPEVWEMADGAILHGGADLDGDGLEDGWIAATIAPGATGQYRAGRVYLAPYTGPGVVEMETAAPATILGETEFDHTGFSTATTDLDGDGQADLVVGAAGNYQLARHPGKVMAYLGPLSGVYTVADADGLWVGESLDDHLGVAVAAADLDGSGFGDIAVGAPFASNAAGTWTGRVYVLLDPLALP